MVGFTYRRVPAIGLARQLVAEGKLGTIRHVRAQYLQDWIADPEAPLSWRLDKEKAGSGALGDIGAHIVDLTQFITGDRITEVSGQLETFVKERPIAAEHSGLSGTAGAERGPVTVDDAASSWRSSAPARSASSRRPGSRPAARTRSGSRSTARGQSAVRLRGHERAALLRRRPRTGRDGRLPPHPRHRARRTRTSPRGGRPATCSATSTASPIKWSTSSPRSPMASIRRRRSRTGCRSSVCWPRSRTSSASRQWQEIPE